MAYRIQYLNYETSRTLVLNEYDSGSNIDFGYIGDIGFGLAPMRQITVRGPQQDGDTYVDYRLDPRIIQLPLVVRPRDAVGKTRMQRLYEAREFLLSVFKPFEKGQISFWPEYNDPSVSRYIDVYPMGDLTFNTDPQIPYQFRTVAQVRAADPLWRTGSVGGSVTISSAQFGSFVPITNPGNYKSWPLILVTGPATNFRIASTKGFAVKAIEFTGTIPAGQTWTIDLSPSSKSVTDISGTNRINLVTLASDFATFAIPYGPSSIRCTATGTTAATSVLVDWIPTYTGV